MPPEQKLPASLLAKGTAVQLGGPQVMPLDRDDVVYLVQQGSLEIYRRTDQGRRFLFSVGSGEIVYPLHAAASSAGFELLALGQGAGLIEFPLASFNSALRRSAVLAERVHSWCQTLATCLEPVTVSGHCTGVVAGERISLRRHEQLAAESGIAWLEVLQGSLRLQGDDMVQIGAGILIPVHPSLWLQAEQPDTQVQVHDGKALRRAGRLPEALINLQASVLSRARQQAIAQAQAETDRAQRQLEYESTRLQGALGDLATVSARRRGKASVESAQDRLLGACRLVAADMGAAIKAPPQGRPGRQFADPVAAIAAASRLRHRPVTLRAAWWRRDHGPLLVFRDADEQPLAAIRRRGVYRLVDAQSGESHVVDQQQAAGLQPTAVSFLASLPAQRLGPRLLLQTVVRGLGPDLGLLLFCGLMAGLLALAVPVVSQQLFDEVIPLAERDRLLGMTALLLLFALVGAAFELTRGLALLRIEVQVELRLEAGVMDRLLRLPSRFFRDYQSGDLAMRALGISMARRAVSAASVMAVMTGMFSIVNLLLLFLYDLRLALIGLGIAMVAALVFWGRARLLLSNSRATVAQEGRVAGLLLQLMNGIAKLRVAGAEKRAFSVWAEQFARQKRLAYRGGAVENHFQVFQAAYPVFANVVIFAAVYLLTEAALESGALAKEQMLSTGSFVAVIAAFSQFLTGFMGMGLALLGALRAVPLYERARPILAAEPEVKPDCEDPGALTGAIEIAQLNFQYSDHGPAILSDINLNITPGQMVALVGPSGSGKSTLLRLLLGMEQAHDGSIFYDGQSLAHLDIEALRRQIGTVLQKDRVQPGDVFHNIVGQSSSLTISDAWEAARAAGLEDDIQALPMGMHTYVNEGGSTFSGGQRQRLLIARAIAHKPRILLFDEATSALDNKTQQVVSNALAALRVTRIVIAHRLSTIEHADIIHVLEAGRIVESGSYSELLKREGLFARLARRQLA